MGNKQELEVSKHAATGLWPNWDHEDMVGWLTCLECRTGGIQALLEGQEGKVRRESGPSCDGELLECMEFCPGMAQESVKSWQVKINGQTNTVCSCSWYLLWIAWSERENRWGLLKQLEEASHSQAQVLAGVHKAPWYLQPVIVRKIQKKLWGWRMAEKSGKKEYLIWIIFWVTLLGSRRLHRNYLTVSFSG